MSNGSERMRREVMINVVRAFHNGTLAQEIDRLPLKLRPIHSQPSRCCIYHDRAFLKYQLMALMGFDCNDENCEERPLSDYLADMLAHPERRPEIPITVCQAGCSGCPPVQMNVTSNCRGCFARPCVYNCPKKCVAVYDQRSHIDTDKCVKCGKCAQVCPFGAIVKTKVPCEDACPTGAIHKNEFGVAEIDYSKCIFCGKCFQRCPFGAIMERSEMLRVLQAIHSGKRVIAMIAPSAQFQFPGGLEKLYSAVKAAGFAEVIEVALGAEMTTENEAKEFIHRMESGEKLMTTSCCSAWVEFAKRHIPSIVSAVSDTPSPMIYTGRIAREKYPDGYTVFIGPCIAKRYEAMQHPEEVDACMTYEELGSMIAGLGVDIMSQPDFHFEHPASASARNYAKSCGVTEAVLKTLLDGTGKEIKLDAKSFNGIDAKTAALLRLHAAGKLPGNFIEVMSCPGGCVGGPCSLVTK